MTYTPNPEPRTPWYVWFVAAGWCALCLMPVAALWVWRVFF